MTETITMTAEELEQLINENIQLGYKRGIQQGINISMYEQLEKEHENYLESIKNTHIDFSTGKVVKLR